MLILILKWLWTNYCVLWFAPIKSGYYMRPGSAELGTCHPAYILMTELKCHEWCRSLPSQTPPWLSQKQLHLLASSMASLKSGLFLWGEVATILRSLQGLTFLGIWADWHSMVSSSHIPESLVLLWEPSHPLRGALKPSKAPSASLVCTSLVPANPGQHLYIVHTY